MVRSRLGHDLIKHRPQFGEIHRLGQMIVESGLAPSFDVFGLASRGKCNASHLLSPLYFTDDVVTAAVGQAEIADNRVEVLRGGKGHRALHRISRRNRVSEVPE